MSKERRHKEVKEYNNNEEEEEDIIISNIIKRNVDMEIILKWREYRIVKEEIERGMKLLQLIEKLIMNEFIYGSDWDSFTSSSSMISSSGFSTPTSSYLSSSWSSIRTSSPLNSGTSSRGSTNVSTSTSSSSFHYEMRSDGSVVRMQCPKCKAEKFRSMLGFLNHCRIHCHLAFISQDDRLQRCGIPVDSSEVPPDYFTKHPSQMRQEMDLALLRADLASPVSDSVPKIKFSSALLGKGSCGISGGNTVNTTATSTTTQSSKGTRFYEESSILLGNESISSLGDEENPSIIQLPPTSAHTPTHRWRIFLMDYSTSFSVKRHIKAIRFILHPSYHPNDKIVVRDRTMRYHNGHEVNSFSLEGVGWGEFPVRCQLLFWDPKNKPVEIVHLLRIKNSSSKWTISSERIIPLNIDIRTVTGDGANFDNNIKDNISKIDDDELDWSYFDSYTTNNNGNDVDDLNVSDYILMAVGDFPLAGVKGKAAAIVEEDGSSSLNDKYQPAKNIEEFVKLGLNQQRILESERAKALTHYLSMKFSKFTLSSQEVLEWCRRNGEVPLGVLNQIRAVEHTNGGKVDHSQFYYCRFCGVAHHPQDKFDILQRNCCYRPRKIHISSRTPFLPLLEEFPESDLYPCGGEEVKKLKHEIFSSTQFYYKHSPMIRSDYIGDGSGDIGSSGSDGTSSTSDDSVLSTWKVMNSMHQSCPWGDGDQIPLFIHCVMKKFVKDLLSSMMDKAVKESGASSGASGASATSSHLLITPLHLFKVACEEEKFDFLTNKYMAGIGRNKPGSGGNG